MSNRKFKLGDRVVLVRHFTNDKPGSGDYEDDEEFMGKTGTLTDLSLGLLHDVQFDGCNFTSIMYEEQLEHESVYQSPLFKALSED